MKKTTKNCNKQKLISTKDGTKKLFWQAYLLFNITWNFPSFDMSIF